MMKKKFIALRTIALKHSKITTYIHIFQIKNMNENYSIFLIKTFSSL